MTRKFFFLVLLSCLILVSIPLAIGYAQVGVSLGTPTVFLPIISSSASPEEAILILEPGPGSRLTSPLRLSGMADPTFEQNLGIRIMLVDGTILTDTFTTIQADVGERGPFEADIPFSVEGEQQAVIQVFSTSARDGGVTHLSSVFVTLADSGTPSILPAPSTTERIVIYQPELTQLISGGIVHVEGYGLATFEQQLLIEVLDEDGTVIGSAPVIVNAPDAGLPGPFSADIPYMLDIAGPGRVIVRDPSPAFDGDTHLTSVEVNLEN